MATSSPLPDVAPNLPSNNLSASESTKRSISSLLLAAVAGAVIASAGFGGALYYLAWSGRVSLRKTATAKSVPSAEIHTHLLMLEPLLVNLADQDGSTYARLSITLQVEDAVPAKDSKSKEAKGGEDDIAAIRDTALTVIGQQTANSLLAPHGKDDLKTELLKAFNQNNPSIKVRKILFTDFLVQR